MSTKEIGKMIIKMVKVYTITLMETFMKEIMKMMRDMDQVKSITTMGKFPHTFIKEENVLMVDSLIIIFVIDCFIFCWK